jgi:chromosome segregation ATPase
VTKIACLTLLTVSFCLLINCKTTDDPRRGGLFSYNPKAYENRLDERQKRLDELKAQQAREKQVSEQLEKKVAQKQTEKDGLNQKLSALEKDMTGLKKQIQNKNAQNQQQEQALLQIQAKMEILEKELADIQSTPPEDIESQKKEIERLEQTIDELLKEAEALSRM